MTYSDTQPRGTLRYRLSSASLSSSKHISEPGLWGHEYVRHLASELGEEYGIRELGEPEPELETPPEEAKPEADGEKGKETEAPAEAKVEPKPKPVIKLDAVGTIDDLRALSVECASFLLHHNAEPDAVDLLEELEIIERIVELVDDNTFGRVCQYMIACVLFRNPSYKMLIDT